MSKTLEYSSSRKISGGSVVDNSLDNNAGFASSIPRFSGLLEMSRPRLTQLLVGRGTQFHSLTHYLTHT